jgi:hypothetical protein
MDVAKLTAGTPEAYIAMSVLDDLTFLRLNTMIQQCFKHRPVLVWGKARKVISDPDFPTYHQAMQTPEAFEWVAAMDKEICTLNDLQTCKIVRRADVLAPGRKSDNVNLGRSARNTFRMKK